MYDYFTIQDALDAHELGLIVVCHGDFLEVTLEEEKE